MFEFLEKWPDMMTPVTKVEECLPLGGYRKQSRAELQRLWGMGIVTYQMGISVTDELKCHTAH